VTSSVSDKRNDLLHVCALSGSGYDTKVDTNTSEEHESMNKKQLIERMVEHTNSPKSEAQKHLEAFTATISEGLKAGEEIQLPGFGKFYVREQKAREGRNPQSGEKMKIPASKVPAFKAGKSLKDSI
jgi:DNA-binding protein HU-beta